MRTLAYRLLLVLVFTLPLENIVELPGDGRVSKVIGLLAASVWLAAVVTSRRVREPMLAHIFALLFVLWNTLSILWTVDSPATMERVLTYLQLLGVLLVVWDTVTSRAQVRQALMAYLAGSYVATVALFVGYGIQGAASEVNGRVTLGSFHPNDVGMILALALPIAGYVAVTASSSGRWRRFWFVTGICYVPASGFAIMLTGSRAALAAMLPGLLYWGYLVAKRHAALAVGGAAALAGVVVLAVPFLPPRVLLRLQGTDAAVVTGDERSEVWAEAVRLIAEHPVLGIGSGAFRSAAVGVNKVGHNFALSLLAEVGVVGFGLFAALLVLAVAGLRHTDRTLRAMWLALLSAWLFAALLHNWEYRKQTWLFLALVIVCGALRESREARARREAVQEEPATAGASGSGT